MKEVKFKLADGTASTQLGNKISKEDLYGNVRKIVEKDGQYLERGYLSPTGRLLQRAQISNLSVDPDGTPLETPLVLLDGQPAEISPSSFEKESELREVPLTRLVDFNASDVYEVDAAGLKPGLYETVFNYRKSHSPRDALLLVKEGEAFLLVGQFKKTLLVGQTPTYEFFDAAAEEEEADPLDFSMM